MTKAGNYDDHPEYSDRLWYAQSIVTLPERMEKKSSCHCGMEWYDAFRTVGATEIRRLRVIIDELQEKLAEREASRSSS